MQVKYLMGEFMDTWLAEEGNLERWTHGPNEGGLHAREKRVLVTQIAAKAWEQLCHTYDFQASALKLGLLMTAGGSADENIKVQVRISMCLGV